jgi:hypothetical protein
MLLLLATLLLASCAIEPEVRSTLPLAPPPIASQSARLGPLSDQPASPLTTTSTTTVSVSISAALDTPPVTIEVVLTPTAAASFLPTVTPVPPALVLLPTPTSTRIAAATPTVELVTVPITDLVPLTPTVAPALPQPQLTVQAPSPSVTNSVPLPANFQAHGSFASQTIYTDGTVAEQQGSFTISQVAAANVYGANQQVTLTTQRAVGVPDEINVYQIDDYIAVSYTGGEWMLVRREQGSNIVRAIQPITDLAILFPRILAQAEFVGQEEVAGMSSLRYRIDDPQGQGARLIQPLLSLSGEIRALTLEVWVAVPGGYIVAYDFQVELAGARVLDSAGAEVRADQAVTWTYELTPSTEARPITWPLDAPTPDAFPVPGFAPGEFPIPPQTELLALVGGVPDLISAQSAIQVDSFYRTELFTAGWTVEGEGGLLRCTKDGATFQLLITADEITGGSRISILPGD